MKEERRLLRDRWPGLSNFAPVGVVLDRRIYLSVEHAYQASKTENERTRTHISTLPSAAEAKRYGRMVPLRPDWKEVRDVIMLDLLTQKFEDPSYRELLLSTGDQEIVEWNTWHDLYWGKDITTGQGANHLGRMLMYIRDQIRAGLPGV